MSDKKKKILPTLPIEFFNSNLYQRPHTLQPIQKEYISPPHASTLSDIILDGIHTNFKVTFPVSGFKSPFG